MKRIAIIGGGVAGLGAAFKVKRAADEGNDVAFTLFEKDDRVGGKIATEYMDDPSGAGRYIIDGGPDCFLTEKPAVHRLARLMGLYDEELPSDESRKRTWILARGRMHEMPDGVMMFAPTKFLPFATTGLFSWPGKFRMGMDLFIPKKRVLEDETLESFVVRRMGRECLDRLAEPLVGGVHASDPSQMSLMATFPRLLQMEQKHGSLIKGFYESRKKVAEMKKKYPPKPGERPRTFFTTFNQGMAQFTEGLADTVGRESIRTGARIAGVERNGEGWTVRLEDGESLTFDAVIVATEGWAAQALLSDVDAEIGSALAGITHSSSATISFAFDEATVGVDLNAFGLLCPLVERRALLAATYSSTKWPGRAPKGRVLFRAFLGGPVNQDILRQSDDALVEIALRDLRDIIGVKGEPLFHSKVFRWNNGMPQYTLGHLDRVALIDRRLSEIPGLGLAGGSYRGVGIPNCIETGEQAVSKVLGEWGITLAEDAAEEKRAY